ncbi:30S ribosomal protein S12 [archaeon]|nr:30S ribosomal protein S12 [archaeon]
MATKTQRLKSVYKRKIKNKKPKLNGGPQKKGIVLRLRICTPRKPNSARRPAVKLKLSTRKRALAHIPGSGHNLRKFSKVLVNGNAARDLPVVNYTCIRGVYDFMPLQSAKKRRSIYGLKKDPLLKTHVRRKFRNML